MYIQHKSDPEREDERIEPHWSAWWEHIKKAFSLRTKALGGDKEKEGQRGM
jgi:hypothetical protein